VASALGLALSLTGFVATARSAASSQPAPGVVAPAVSTEPFVVAPSVRLAAAESTASAAPKPSADPAKGVPVRLVVRSLRIEVPVVPIEAPAGVLVPPGDPQTLGWWRDGAKPGAARGSALITGHTVSTGGGAFDDLDTLERGDRVRVRTTHGRIDYRVAAVTIYRKASLADDARRIFSQSVPGRLVLITCEDWNGVVYLSNAVVLAEPVQPAP
jgi:LPXTG-site transpeptidase (sortase) family protein